MGPPFAGWARRSREFHRRIAPQSGRGSSRATSGDRLLHLTRYLTIFGTVLSVTTAQADPLADTRILRSLAAEAAEVIRLQARHRVTETYAREMKTEAREQLQSTAKSTDSPQLKPLAAKALAALDRNDAGALTAIAQQLFSMEGPHGRAD